MSRGIKKQKDKKLARSTSLFGLTRFANGQFLVQDCPPCGNANRDDLINVVGVFDTISEASAAYVRAVSRFLL